jgi:hypothetical protein
MPVTRYCTPHRMRRPSVCQRSQRAAFHHICSPLDQIEDTTIQMPQGTTVTSIQSACSRERSKAMGAESLRWCQEGRGAGARASSQSAKAARSWCAMVSAG